VKFLAVTLDRTEKQVTIGGHAATLDGVNQLEMALRESELFANPKQEEASLDAGTRRYKFQVSCKLKGDG
jgi:Tfp pilus assembly protein PilN